MDRYNIRCFLKQKGNCPPLSIPRLLSSNLCRRRGCALSASSARITGTNANPILKNTPLTAAAKGILAEAQLIVSPPLRKVEGEVASNNGRLGNYNYRIAVTRITCPKTTLRSQSMDVDD